MSAPAPQTTAEELWNRLAAAGRDDGAEVDRILWLLRGLAARKASDFLARLGAGRAYLLRGQREEGLYHVEAAWGLRHGRSYSDLFNLSGVLLDCGKLLEAREVNSILLNGQEARHDSFLWTSTHLLGFRTGDLALCDRAEDATGASAPEWRHWRDLLVESGLADAFHRHQDIVESIVGPHACVFMGEVMTDGEGETSAYLEYFTGLDQDACFELQDAIADRIDSDELISVSDYVAVAVRGPYACRIEAAA